MSEKSDLARLVRLQKVIKALRERDHVQANRQVADADKSIEELNRMMTRENPVVALFPDLLARHFEQMLKQRAEASRAAQETADELLKEKKKLDNMEDRHERAKGLEQRARDARLQHEMLDQRSARPVSASSKIGGIT